MSAHIKACKQKQFPPVIKQIESSWQITNAYLFPSLSIFQKAENSTQVGKAISFRQYSMKDFAVAPATRQSPLTHALVERARKDCLVLGVGRVCPYSYLVLIFPVQDVTLWVHLQGHRSPCLGGLQNKRYKTRFYWCLPSLTQFHENFRPQKKIIHIWTINRRPLGLNSHLSML